MSDTPRTDEQEAIYRAEWLHNHNAPKDWIVLKDREIGAIKHENTVLRSSLEKSEKTCAEYAHQLQRKLRVAEELETAEVENDALRSSLDAANRALAEARQSETDCRQIIDTYVDETGCLYGSITEVRAQLAEARKDKDYAVEMWDRTVGELQKAGDAITEGRAKLAAEVQRRSVVEYRTLPFEQLTPIERELLRCEGTIQSYKEACRLGNAEVKRIETRQAIAEASAELLAKDKESLSAQLSAAAAREAALVEALKALKAGVIEVLMPAVNSAIKSGYVITMFSPEDMQWAKAMELTDAALARCSPIEKPKP